MASGSQQMLNVKKWNIVYPVYINSKKTVAEGRRIGAARACENPTCLEINDCCNYLKIPCAIELDKAYPRDFMQRGRVRVLLKREDGSLYNPAILNSISYNTLFGHLAFRLAALRKVLSIFIKDLDRRREDTQVDALKQIKIIDDLEDAGGATQSDFDRRQDLRNVVAMEDWKEVDWREKSRPLWLREGDSNTRFFHMAASARRRNNCITSICEQGVTYTVGQRSLLSGNFSEEEVLKALGDLKAEGSPGPDGFQRSSS